MPEVALPQERGSGERTRQRKSIKDRHRETERHSERERETGHMREKVPA